MTTTPNGDPEKPDRALNVKPNVLFTEERKNAAVERLKKRGWQFGAGTTGRNITGDNMSVSLLLKTGRIMGVERNTWLGIFATFPLLLQAYVFAWLAPSWAAWTLFPFFAASVVGAYCWYKTGLETGIERENTRLDKIYRQCEDEHSKREEDLNDKIAQLRDQIKELREERHQNNKTHDLLDGIAEKLEADERDLLNGIAEKAEEDNTSTGKSAA